jgi:hypothetical protein
VEVAGAGKQSLDPDSAEVATAGAAGNGRIRTCANSGGRSRLHPDGAEVAVARAASGS